MRKEDFIIMVIFSLCLLSVPAFYFLGILVDMIDEMKNKKLKKEPNENKKTN
jgi:hypothetical protein